VNASDACLALIRKSENFVALPYLCPAGVPTIGYGSTRYADGTAVKLTDKSIDRSIAESLMRVTLIEYEEAVRRCVKVPLSQGQFDALVDFAYNAGAHNLRTSTLLKLLNSGDYAGAARQFERWVFGGGKRLPGLIIRRDAERNLFDGVAK